MTKEARNILWGALVAASLFSAVSGAVVLISILAKQIEHWQLALILIGLGVIGFSTAAWLDKTDKP